ncbi:hypothetical protein LBMAG27_06480 [Bacteroidota bacterium]|nr:hypothetical protein LBMAG27_06480 [Bacteroidota bacterium]
MKSITFTILLLLSIISFSQAQFPAYTFSNTGIDKGYFLFTPTDQNGMAPSSHYFAIMDYTGHLIYYFNGYSQATSSIINFSLFKNHLFSFYRGGKFFLADSNFNVVDTITATSGYYNDPHDIQLLSNGNYIILAKELVTMDLSGFNLFTHTYSPGDSSALVTCGVLQEFNPAGQLVWQWKTQDHFTFDEAHPFWLFAPDTLDWSHLNAVEEDLDGNILVSSRFFNEIFKVNHTTGNIMWRLGGSHNQFTFIGDSIPFKGQHDIRVHPDGSYTLFDNGFFYPSHKAKAEQFLLDTVAYTATFIRKVYAANFGFSGSRGNAQFFNNGNVMIDWGGMSNDNLVFSIVDSSNSEICRLSFDDSLTSYRSYYYPELPFQINQPEISCFDSLGYTLLRAPEGYAKYMWSNGSTTSSIVVQAPDTVWVYVQSGTMEGMLSSKKFIVDGNTQCENFIPNYNSGLLKIFPNPTTDIVFVSGKMVSLIEIENLLGQKVFNETYSDSLMTRVISINNFSPSIYFIKIKTEESDFIYKIEKF